MFETPTPTPTQAQERRLYHLLYETIPHTLIQEDMGKVDLSMYADCGTPMCLLGYAAVDPVFMSEGLYISRMDFIHFGRQVKESSDSTFFGKWAAVKMFGGETERNTREELIHRRDKLQTYLEVLTKRTEEETD